MPYKNNEPLDNYCLTAILGFMVASGLLAMCLVGASLCLLTLTR